MHAACRCFRSEAAELVYRQLFEMGAERQTLVAALGGGVTGDLAGFVAATYARGLPLLQIGSGGARLPAALRDGGGAPDPGGRTRGRRDRRLGRLRRCDLCTRPAAASDRKRRSSSTGSSSRWGRSARPWWPHSGAA